MSPGCIFKGLMSSLEDAVTNRRNIVFSVHVQSTKRGYGIICFCERFDCFASPGPMYINLKNLMYLCVAVRFINAGFCKMKGVPRKIIPVLVFVHSTSKNAFFSVKLTPSIWCCDVLHMGFIKIQDRGTVLKPIFLVRF